MKRVFNDTNIEKDLFGEDMNIESKTYSFTGQYDIFKYVNFNSYVFILD